MKIRHIKLRGLNAGGIAHLIAPLAIVVLVGIIGTYMLVASHAATPCSASDISSGTAYYKNLRGECSTSSAPKKTSTASTPTSSCSGDKQRAGCSQIAQQSKARHKDSANGETAKIPLSPTSNEPPTETAQVVSSIPAAPTAKPAGDIIITTYVNDPEIDKKGGKDHRIGSVSIKVERIGGKENCDNKKSQTSKTNSMQEILKKDGTKVFVKGTVHFLGCDTGKYKVTLLGRKGYTPAGSTTKEFNLNNDEIQKVYFVVNKVQAKTVSTDTTQTGSVQ
ncbi:MAG: hypothetical protein JWO35_35 [Candidatus Saccharibacteria bacterium]|nr:hypothetical protein [Candidatus Saccharibacteria bacterium]